MSVLVNLEIPPIINSPDKYTPDTLVDIDDIAVTGNLYMLTWGDIFLVIY